MYFNSIHSNLQKPYRFFFWHRQLNILPENTAIYRLATSRVFFYVFTIFSHNNHLLFFDNILVIQ